MWPKQLPTDLHSVLTMLDQPSTDQHISRNKGTASFRSKAEEKQLACAAGTS